MIRTKHNNKKKYTKPGPKSGFRQTHADKAYKMALYGLTEDEMVGIMDIPINTWRVWKRNHPELQEALDKGRTLADIEVSHAAYKKAVGFEIDDIHVSVTPSGKVVTTPIKKYFPPDMKAIQMWLSNRSKGRWTIMNHHKVEHSGEIRHRQEEVNLKDFSTDELKALKKLSVLQN